METTAKMKNKSASKKKIVFNETPLRTSNNFRINNIELKGIILPQHPKKFKNVKIIKQDALIAEDINYTPLTYGIGKIVEQNNIENTNNKLKIISNAKKENINIVYNFDDNNIELINQIEIIAKGGLNLTVLYNSKTEKACFHNGILRLTAEENAQVNVTIINLLNESSNTFYAIENKLKSNSNVKYTIIDIGGKNSISNYYTNIIGENAENDLKTIYLGRNNQIKDINYIAELRGEKSNIDIDVQGALKDLANKHFKGTIDFKKGCKKAKGNENEYCMLLSDKAKSIALPMLLCTEEDVEGNHSTASGKVDEKIMFYIMTRGISYKDAIKLAVKAKLNIILERITDEELKNRIIAEIDKRLD